MPVKLSDISWFFNSWVTGKRWRSVLVFPFFIFVRQRCLLKVLRFNMRRITINIQLISLWHSKNRSKWKTINSIKFYRHKTTFSLSLSLEEFYFRWLQNSSMEIGETAWIPLIFNHLNWNPNLSRPKPSPNLTQPSKPCQNPAQNSQNCPQMHLIVILQTVI